MKLFESWASAFLFFIKAIVFVVPVCRIFDPEIKEGATGLLDGTSRNFCCKNFLRSCSSRLRFYINAEDDGASLLCCPFVNSFIYGDGWPIKPRFCISSSLLYGTLLKGFNWKCIRAKSSCLLSVIRENDLGS